MNQAAATCIPVDAMPCASPLAMPDGWMLPTGMPFASPSQHLRGILNAVHDENRKARYL